MGHCGIQHHGLAFILVLTPYLCPLGYIFYLSLYRPFSNLYSRSFIVLTFVLTLALTLALTLVLTLVLNELHSP
jgi:hypothetical protein